MFIIDFIKPNVERKSKTYFNLYATVKKIFKRNEKIYSLDMKFQWLYDEFSLSLQLLIFKLFHSLFKFNSFWSHSLIQCERMNYCSWFLCYNVGSTRFPASWCKENISKQKQRTNNECCKHNPTRMVQTFIYKDI